MTFRNIFIFSTVVVAILYFWPNQAAKVARKIGDTTVSAVKAGVSEAKGK